MADDGDPRGVRSIVSLLNGSPEQWFDAEQRKELRRHGLRIEADRITKPGQGDRDRLPGRELLNGAALALPVEPIGRRHDIPVQRPWPRAGTLEFFVDREELVASRVRQ